MLSKDEERDIERMAMSEEAAHMASRENTSTNKPNIGNGVQQSFGTGATRSTSEGKIDYEGHLSPDVLEVFGAYMNRHRIQRNGQLRASDNWQEGIPLPNYVKSLIRHTFEFWRMWRGHEVPNPDANGAPFTFEEVTSAIMFNVMGIIFEMSRDTSSGFLRATYCSKDFRQHLEAAGRPAPDPRSFEKVSERNKVAVEHLNQQAVVGQKLTDQLCRDGECQGPIASRPGGY